MSAPELAGNAPRGAFAKGVKSDFGASGLVFGVIDGCGLSSAGSGCTGNCRAGNGCTGVAASRVAASGFRSAEAGTNGVIGANSGSLLAGADGSGSGRAETDGTFSSATGDGVTCGTGRGSTGLSWRWISSTGGFRLSAAATGSSGSGGIGSALSLSACPANDCPADGGVSAGCSGGAGMASAGGTGIFFSATCVGGVSVTNTDTANRTARNARLIGIVRLRRSTTGPFQIDELQLLDHQIEAVGPLPRRHEDGSSFCRRQVGQITGRIAACHRISDGSKVG